MPLVKWVLNNRDFKAISFYEMGKKWRIKDRDLKYLHQRSLRREIINCNDSRKQSPRKWISFFWKKTLNKLIPRRKVMASSMHPHLFSIRLLLSPTGEVEPWRGDMLSFHFKTTSLVILGMTDFLFSNPTLPCLLRWWLHVICASTFLFHWDSLSLSLSLQLVRWRGDM